MISVDSDSNVTIEIKKSKFVAYAWHVTDVEIAKQHIQHLHDIHSDATHICYAYVLSHPSAEKAVDDGEPDGTAGKPILDVIKKRGLTDVLVAVVRYFGGIKLGAGGLVRAYSSSASSAIDEAGSAEYAQAYHYEANVDLNKYKEFDNYIKSKGAVVVSKVFGEKVNVQLYAFEPLEYASADMTLIECKMTRKG